MVAFMCNPRISGVKAIVGHSKFEYSLEYIVSPYL